MAQFMYYPENVLFNNIPPTIDKEFLRHHFSSAYYAQETAFNKNPGGGEPCRLKIEMLYAERSTSKLFMTNVKLRFVFT